MLRKRFEFGGDGVGTQQCGERDTKRGGCDLHQPKSSSLIADGIVRDALPEEGLQSLPMVL